MYYKNINFEELNNLLNNNNTILIDVRNVEEWQQDHLPNSTNLPLDEIDIDQITTLCNTLSANQSLTVTKPINLVFICKVGRRSVQAIHDLLEDEDMVDNMVEIKGYKFMIYNLEGGMSKLRYYNHI